MPPPDPFQTAVNCGLPRTGTEKGRFRPTFLRGGRLSSVAIEAAELALIVEGIKWSGARRRPRWQSAALSL